MEEVNWIDGKLYLKSEDTKTDSPRVLYMPDDLQRVLIAWKQRCALKWPTCPWICHRGGIRLESLKRSWRKACVRVGLGELVHDPEQNKLVWRGKIPHDVRRTAVRNMLRAGIPEKIAMAISGHKTRSVFDRYNIVNEADLRTAAHRLNAYFENERGTLTGTLAELIPNAPADKTSDLIGITEGIVEPASGIEPPTCGLRIPGAAFPSPIRFSAKYAYFGEQRRGLKRMISPPGYP